MLLSEDSGYIIFTNWRQTQTLILLCTIILPRHDHVTMFHWSPVQSSTHFILSLAMFQITISLAHCSYYRINDYCMLLHGAASKHYNKQRILKCSVPQMFCRHTNWYTKHSQTILQGAIIFINYSIKFLHWWRHMLSNFNKFECTCR